MNAYLLTGIPDQEAPRYYGTLADAHENAKTALLLKPGAMVEEVRIELVDIETEKAAILRILNGIGRFQSAPLRTWKLTQRKGLKEIENGE